MKLFDFALRVLLLFVWAFAVAISLAPLAHSQVDVFISGRNPYTVIGRSVAWGSGAGAVNNNFVFSPVTTDSSICVYVRNNNPTNAHSFTLAVQQTGDPQVFRFTGNGGAWGATQSANTFPASVAANSTIGFYFRSNAAAMLALQFTGSVVQAGTPDTADIFAVQPSSQSNCGVTFSNTPVVGPAAAGTTVAINPILIGAYQMNTGTTTQTIRPLYSENTTNGFIVGTQNGLNSDGSGVGYHTESLNDGGLGNVGIVSVLPHGSMDDAGGGTLARFKNSHKFGLETSSPFAFGANEVIHDSWGVFTDNVNPTAGFNLMAVNENGSSPGGLMLNRIIIGCSAACDVQIWRTSALGSACTALTPFKVFEESVAAATSTTAVKGTCTTNPATINQVMHVFVAAGATQIVDMTGYWQHVATTGAKGFMLLAGAAVTGTVSTTIEWTERN